MLSPLLILSLLAFAVHAYQLVETGQEVPCQYGSLTLSHNLVGDRLLFFTNFSDAYRCNRSLPIDTLQLLNVSSIVLSINNTVLGSSREREGCFLRDGHCHAPLKVVILIKIAINVTLLPALVAPDQHILCNESTLYIDMGFDCMVTPYIPFLLYTMEDCLICADDDIHAPSKNGTQAKEEHSPLYWYLQCLSSEGMVGNDTICGESMCVHLYRSGLYLDQCDEQNEREMPPWYQMVVHLVARSFNYGDEVAYRDVWWLIGVELLERHCDLKDHTLSKEEMEEEHSFFNSFIEHFKTDDHEPELCASIGEYFDQHYNETMAKMLFNQWYYQGFKFALSPDRDMKLNAIYLISFMSALPFILIVIVIYCVYKMRQWRLKLRVTQHV